MLDLPAPATRGDHDRLPRAAPHPPRRPPPPRRHGGPAHHALRPRSRERPRSGVLPRLPRAGLLVAPPAPGRRRRGVPGDRTGPAGLRRVERAGGRSPAYGLGNLCGDLADLLDALEVDRAVFVGHDWGGFVAWAMPVLFPAGSRAPSACAPRTRRSPPPRSCGRCSRTDEKMYMLWFQQPGVAEAVMDPQARAVRDADGRRDRPGRADGAAGRRAEGMDLNPFRRPGRRAGARRRIATPRRPRVRTLRAHRLPRRHQLVPQHRRQPRPSPAWATQPLALPSLMICAEWDPALPPAFAANMPNLCSTSRCTRWPRPATGCSRRSPRR